MKNLIFVTFFTLNFAGVLASSLDNSCEGINLSKGNWKMIIPNIPMSPRFGNQLKNIPLEIKIKSNASTVENDVTLPSRLFNISTKSTIEQFNYFNYLFLSELPPFGCAVYLVSHDEAPITWDSIWGKPVLSYVIDRSNSDDNTFNLRSSYDGFEKIETTLSLIKY